MVVLDVLCVSADVNLTMADFYTYNRLVSTFVGHWDSHGTAHGGAPCARSFTAFFTLRRRYNTDPSNPMQRLGSYAVCWTGQMILWTT